MNIPLLDEILESKSKKIPFALLYRPHHTGEKIIEVMTGNLSTYDSLTSIPLPTNENLKTNNIKNSVLVVIPYKQLKDRGYEYNDDDASLIVMNIDQYETIEITTAIQKIDDFPIAVSHSDFDTDDNSYAEIIEKIIEDEIGKGEGSNFVIKRLFIADITDYSVATSLSLFRNLIQNETGAYWTFIVNTGERTLIGASPEMHVSLNNNTVTMNPISGTYYYSNSGPTKDGLLNFLSSSKETSELYMVVEEELKMISHFCPQGGNVFGPFLKEMSRLAHTEYFIKGHTYSNPWDILSSTLFAPTVTGSPIENACRIIKKYETTGRGYYGGICALVGKDEFGDYTIDSTILIRTADIDNNGHMKIAVGTTIINHSNPCSEVLETKEKAKFFLDVINNGVTSNA